MKNLETERIQYGSCKNEKKYVSIYELKHKICLTTEIKLSQVTILKVNVTRSSVIKPYKKYLGPMDFVEIQILNLSTLFLQ